MPARGSCGLVDIEQGRRADQTRRIGAQRGHQGVVRHVLAHDQGQVAEDRLLPRHRLQDRHWHIQKCLQVQFKEHRRVRQFIGLAPLRVQFTHVADQAPVHFNRRSAPGASPGGWRPLKTA
jgi:hypothetical protein